MLPQGIGYERNALLVSKTPLDATNATSVESLLISGEQPVGTARRLAFLIDDVPYVISGSELVSISGGVTVENILANGNTAAELEMLTDIPALVGKKFYPIIALHADGEISASPTIKMGLQYRSNTAVFEKIVETASYELTAAEGAVPRIVSITCETTTAGEGTATVQVRLRVGDDWSEYMPLGSAAQQEAEAVQFRLVYRVTNIDSEDSAQVNNITIRHTLGATAVSGNVAELYSVVQNYEEALQTCYVVIRHAKLRDATMQAYVNFMQPPKSRELIFIGEGTGELTQYVLGLSGVADTNIDPNTLQVFADGELLDGISYNTEVNEVTVNAPIGTAITASYDYDHGVEDWRPMEQLMNSQPYKDDDGTYMTRFNYTLPDDEAVDTSLSNIRINLTRNDGSVVDEDLGLATGLMQQIILPHAAKQETISLNADWFYDPETRTLTFVAVKNTQLLLSYEYLGETQIIYSWAAGWTVAL